MSRLGELRIEPTDKRVRALLDGSAVLDSRAALLVWEPRRVVPSYAVPVADVDAELVPVDGEHEVPDGIEAMGPTLDGMRVLDPSVPFAVHTTPGRRLELRRGGRTAQAFGPDDPDLAGHVVLDFDGFDAWLEEDEPNVGHPRDPFHRIDIARTDRRIEVARDGVVLAQSVALSALFEPPLPPRWYFPREDVRLDLLTPTSTRTTCAYKGHATYWATPDGTEVAWSYEDPLPEAHAIAGHVCFFNERVDLTVDGVPQERPVTPWS